MAEETFAHVTPVGRRRYLLRSAAIALAAALPRRAQAQGGDSDADRRREGDLVGSWFARVTATNPPIGQFNTLTTFHADGTIVDSRRYLAKPTPFGDLRPPEISVDRESSQRGCCWLVYQFM